MTRRLRNIVTGATFVWTPQLAARADMMEIAPTVAPARRPPDAKPLTADGTANDVHLVELHQQGWTLARIAARIGCSGSTVRRRLRRAGVRQRPATTRAEQHRHNRAVIEHLIRLLRAHRGRQPPPYRAVVELLNAAGSTSSRGTPWTYRSLYRMLQRAGFGGLHGLRAAMDRGRARVPAVGAPEKRAFLQSRERSTPTPW